MVEYKVIHKVTWTISLPEAATVFRRLYLEYQERACGAGVQYFTYRQCFYFKERNDADLLIPM